MGTTNSLVAGRPSLPRSDAVLLRLQLIGRMQALTLDNRSVLPLGRKTRALLAVLALSGRRPVLRLRLAELLWSRRSEDQARASLRQEIHRLLDALSPVGADVIMVDRHMLALKPGLTAVDAERILNAGPNQADTLPSMNGVLLEELTGTDPALDGWLRVERERLREHATTLFEGVLNRRRDPQGLLEAARQLLLIDPVHEGAWRGTIRARQLLGEPMLAREAAERCAEIMAGRPGVVPSAETLRVLAEFNCAPNGFAVPAPGEAEQNGEVPPEALQDLPVAEPVRPVPAEVPNMLRQQNGGLPLVAVLPLVDLDGRSDREALTHGLTEALQVTLLRYGSLCLLAGSELDASLAGGRDDAALRRGFGVDYVLDGTVQGDGEQLRTVIRLTDIRQHGQIVWGRRFRADGTADLPERIVGEISARLPTEIMLLESHRLRRRPVSELEPEQLVLRAFSAVLTSDRDRMDQACALLDRSRELGVDTAVALTVDALANLLRALQRWDPPGIAARAAARRSAEAVERAPTLSAALTVRCLIRSELDDEPEAALLLAERARELQPFSSGAWAVGAFPLLRLGRLNEARRHFERAKQLFPTHPLDIVLDLPGVMLPLLQGRHEAAAAAGLAASELRPCFAPTLVPFLSALGHLGRQREIARIRRQLLTLWPDATVADLVGRAGLRGAGDAERFGAGLQAAGVPAGTPGQLGATSLAG